MGKLVLTDEYLMSRYLNTAKSANRMILKKFGTVEGRCKEAADIMVEELNRVGIKAEPHFGWCLFDKSEGLSGEPCAPHCYVLAHKGTDRVYLDATAEQFSRYLDEPVPTAIVLVNCRPYWFRSSKPSNREMKERCGY